MAKIGIDAEQFFKDHLEKHYEELSKRIGESVQNAIKEELYSKDTKVTLEEALQNIILTSVGAATGETITFLISATARAIEINNAKLYYELIGSKKSKSKRPKSNE